MNAPNEDPLRSIAPLPRPGRAHAAPTPARGRLALVAACLAAAVGTSIVGACAWVPPPGVKPPVISVRDFAIRDLGRDEIRFSLTLDAENPNDFDVPVTDLRFELDLLGRPFASGNARQNKVVLERNATRPLPVEFTVPTSRLIAFVRDLSLLELTALSYRLKGSARWGDGVFSIPFERRGELDVLRKFRDVLRPLLGS